MPSEQPMQAAGRYERQDANSRGLVYFALITAVLLMLTALAARWLFLELRPEDRVNPAMMPFVNSRPLPPEPRLQAAPLEDLERYRASQQQALHSYGWVNRSQGVVRIPVERAEELLLQRGFPVRPQAPAGNAAVPAPVRQENSSDEVPQ